MKGMAGRKKAGLTGWITPTNRKKWGEENTKNEMRCQEREAIRVEVRTGNGHEARIFQ